MTEVKIYGYLAKLFGNSFKIYLGRLNDVIQAIDSIKSGFRQKIIELQTNGFSYCIQRTSNTINIIPFINGAGRAVMRVISVILVVVGIVLLFIPGFQMLGTQMIQMGLQIGIAAFTPIPKIRFPSSDATVGGSTAEVKKGNQSYVFSNRENLATQGSLVRLGYGQLKINSNIINVSIKNYPTNLSFESENYFYRSESDSTSIFAAVFESEL
jgi:predicted phage tail protein